MVEVLAAQVRVRVQGQAEELEAELLAMAELVHSWKQGD